MGKTRQVPLKFVYFHDCVCQHLKEQTRKRTNKVIAKLGHIMALSWGFTKDIWGNNKNIGHSGINKSLGPFKICPVINAMHN